MVTPPTVRATPPAPPVPPIRPAAQPCLRPSLTHRPAAHTRTPLPGRPHALQRPDRVPGGRFHLLRQQRSLLFQLGGCRLYDPRGDQGGLHLLHACLSVSVATSVAAALAAAALAAALALAAAALATAHVAGASLPSLGSLRLQVPRLVRPEERGIPLVLLRGRLPGSVHPERLLRRDDVPGSRFICGSTLQLLCARHRLPHLFLPIRPAPQPCLLPSLSHRPAAHTRRPPSWQAICTSRTRQSARRP
jgi:hypothetical protein